MEPCAADGEKVGKPDGGDFGVEPIAHGVDEDAGAKALGEWCAGKVADDEAALAAGSFAAIPARGAVAPMAAAVVEAGAEAVVDALGVAVIARFADFGATPPEVQGVGGPFDGGVEHEEVCQCAVFSVQQEGVPGPWLAGRQAATFRGGVRGTVSPERNPPVEHSRLTRTPPRWRKVVGEGRKHGG